MERLVAGCDNGVVMRSPRPDGSSPDFDYGKADDGKAKPAQPGRARICVLALAEQGDSGPRRPLTSGGGVGVRVPAGSAPFCWGWFPHPSRPQPMRCWRSPIAITASKARSSPSEPASSHSWTRRLARLEKRSRLGLMEIIPLAPDLDRPERWRAV